MSKEKIVLDNEIKLITSIIVNDDAAKAFNNINTKLLKTPYAKVIFSWTKEYFNTYKKSCGTDIQEIYKQKRGQFSEDDDATNDSIALFLSNLSNKWSEYQDQNNFNFTIDMGHKYLSEQNDKLFSDGLKELLDNGEDTTAYIAAYKPYANASALPPMDCAEDLKTMKLPKQKFIVPDLFGWGLIMFCGTHKIGKSYMMLQLAVEVSTGGIFLGKYRCKQRNVIYLCLEDGRERMQKRIIELGYENKDLSNLKLVYESRKGAEGLADLSLRLKEAPGTRLVIIDALATFRGMAHSKNIFQSDYDTMFEIKRWAIEHKVCIIIAHHTRKPGINSDGPTDIVDSVNGTNGLGAAVDQTFIMTRPRKSQDGKLYTTSRDLPEKDLAIHYEHHQGGWTELGDADKFELKEERLKILSILEDSKIFMKTSTIAKLAGTKLSNTSQLLKKLEIDGYVKSGKYGEYIYNES